MSEKRSRKITSRISINTSPPKSQTSKPHRCTKAHRLSSKTDSSSSESENGIVRKRHKYVHKTHRTRSNSRSPKTNNTPPESFKDRSAGKDRLHQPVKPCKVCGGLVQASNKNHTQNYSNKSAKSDFSGNCDPPEEDSGTRLSSGSRYQTTKFLPEENPLNKTDALSAALISQENVESDEDLPSLVSSSDDETSQRGLEEALRNIHRHRRNVDTADKGTDDEVTPHGSQSDEEQEDEIAKKLRSLVNKVLTKDRD